MLAKITLLSLSLLSFAACTATTAPDTASVRSAASVAALDGTWSFDGEYEEKIRFARGSDGHTTWTSFAVEKPGAETIFLEVPVDLVADGPSRFAMKIAGTPTGLHAERAKGSPVTAMPVRVVDARTIVVSDPNKGELVFTKDD